MTHWEKVEHLINCLETHGIARSTVAPPLYRFLWRLGIEVLPPHFQSVTSITLLTGCVFGPAFGAAFGALIWISSWWLTDLEFPLVALALLSAVSGAMFGLIMAASYTSQAKWLKLPAWHKYPSIDHAEAESGPAPRRAWADITKHSLVVMAVIAIVISLAVPARRAPPVFFEGISQYGWMNRLIWDEDPENRRKAAIALGEILRNEECHCRTVIMSALASNGAESKPAIPALKELLNHKNDELKRAALSAIERIDPDEYKALTRRE
jgi:hypothetical protein